MLLFARSGVNTQMKDTWRGYPWTALHIAAVKDYDKIVRLLHRPGQTRVCKQGPDKPLCHWPKALDIKRSSSY